jgi:hypothetical protein
LAFDIFIEHHNLLYLVKETVTGGTVLAPTIILEHLHSYCIYTSANTTDYLAIFRATPVKTGTVGTERLRRYLTTYHAGSVGRIRKAETKQKDKDKDCGTAKETQNELRINTFTQANLSEPSGTLCDCRIRSTRLGLVTYSTHANRFKWSNAQPVG